MTYSNYIAYYFLLLFFAILITVCQIAIIKVFGKGSENAFFQKRFSVHLNLPNLLYLNKRLCRL
jgi:hypothetical protein